MLVSDLAFVQSAHHPSENQTANVLAIISAAGFASATIEHTCLAKQERYFKFSMGPGSASQGPSRRYGTDQGVLRNAPKDPKGFLRTPKDS